MKKTFRHILISLLFYTVGHSQPFDLADTNVKAGQFQHLYGIHFEFASSNLQVTALAQLDSIVSFLNSNPTARIELGVHTDFRGDDKQNLELSKNRASTLKKYFLDKGVAPDRINAVGFGETKPVIEYEDWKKLTDTHRCGYYGRGNRRVTIVVTSI